VGRLRSHPSLPKHTAESSKRIHQTLVGTNTSAFRLPRIEAKRSFDLLVASTALGITAPVLAASAAGVLLSMGRPIFFMQDRAGLKGQSFRVIKLRTMRPPRSGEDEVASDADRLTWVGKFLRSTSLDELPSLLNVIKGDMSLVGPRPLLVRYLSRYSPRQARRHEVKPGVTGWAQVNGRNMVSWRERFEMDIWYVDNSNPLLDLKILALTMLKVFQQEGIGASGQATMGEFMGCA